VQSFVDARVPTVVASLWQVEEGATRELMKEFYRQLAEGKTYSAALALAQQHLMESEKYSNPFYWAGFMLYGKDGSIDFVESSLPRLLSYVTYGLIGVLSLVFVFLKLRSKKLRQ
jgi:hypothetical protein